ncbi:hypothetical protein BKA62DRAFT_231084 [Auriculariales sp. MPI-PUGE-AT-0066]|nr:hypothetical protein BKA62DRAFT_231084 [Auriculariales sp. MPI-PUGE-AT-0066]
MPVRYIGVMRRMHKVLLPPVVAHQAFNLAAPAQPHTSASATPSTSVHSTAPALETPMQGLVEDGARSSNSRSRSPVARVKAEDDAPAHAFAPPSWLQAAPELSKLSPAALVQSQRSHNDSPITHQPLPGFLAPLATPPPPSPLPSPSPLLDEEVGAMEIDAPEMKRLRLVAGPSSPMMERGSVSLPVVDQPLPTRHVRETRTSPDGRSQTWSVLKPCIEAAILSYLAARFVRLPKAGHESAFDNVLKAVAASLRSLPIVLPQLFGPIGPFDELPLPLPSERTGQKRKRHHPLVVNDSEEELTHALDSGLKPKPAEERFPAGVVRSTMEQLQPSPRCRFIPAADGETSHIAPGTHSLLRHDQYRDGLVDGEAETFLLWPRKATSREAMLYLGSYVLRPAGLDPGTRLVCVGYNMALVEAVRNVVETLQVSEQV